MTNNPINPVFDFAKYGIGARAQQIIDAANQMLTQPASPAAQPLNEELLIIKPASYWMEQAANRPAQLMLFDGFWFDGEICIMFADTNLGKSILNVTLLSFRYIQVNRLYFNGIYSLSCNFLVTSPILKNFL